MISPDIVWSAKIKCAAGVLQLVSITASNAVVAAALLKQLYGANAVVIEPWKSNDR